MKKLKLHREKRHLSLAKMAIKFEITPSYLWMLENGERQPSLAVLKRISKVTQIPINKLIEENHAI